MTEIPKLLLDAEASECLQSSLQPVSGFAELVESSSVEALKTGPLDDAKALRQFIELGQIARFGVIGGLAIVRFYTALVKTDELSSKEAKKIQSDLVAIESNIETILYESSYALQEKLPLGKPSLVKVRDAARGTLDKLNGILKRLNELIDRQRGLTGFS